MRVPAQLSNAFKTDFEPLLSSFLLNHQWIPESDSLTQKRFLSRSVAPHVKVLSELFNRTSEKVASPTSAIDHETYFSESGNPLNRKLAYFLSYMPCNLFRV